MIRPGLGSCALTLWSLAREGERATAAAVVVAGAGAGAAEKDTDDSLSVDSFLGVAGAPAGLKALPPSPPSLFNVDGMPKRPYRKETSCTK